MALGQNDLICRYLDQDGDGSGNSNMAGADYSGERFWIQPAAGQIFVIQRLIISLEDETGFKAETFGKESALALGLTLKSEFDQQVVRTDFLDGDTIKANSHFGIMCYDVDVHNWANTPTDELLLARLSFNRFSVNGEGLKLVGDDNEKLVVTVQDSLAAILRLKFMAQGYLETLE